MKLQNPTSPFALCSLFLHVMLLLQPNINITISRPLGNDTDRFALLKFKESISNDPHGILSMWNDSIQFCSWPGIACTRRRQRVTSLILSNYNLRGPTSPFVGNLSFMASIDLRNNSFFGEIPQQVGRLFRLQSLRLYNNMLEGNIPVNISYCSKLRVIDFSTNRLTGLIPMEIGSLVKLNILILELNNLTGNIPPSLGNISSLEIFTVADNNLFGSIPAEFGRLKSLNFFAVGPNSLSGVIPRSIYNISSMVVFSIGENEFKGTLPPSIGHTLPNLQSFLVDGNNFYGIIPESLSNASQLQFVDMSENNFVGQVPKSLGALQELQLFGLHNNSLGNHLSDSLDFLEPLTNCSQMEALDLSMNKFRGVLTSSVGNLSTKLLQLYLGDNQISGNIPSTLANLDNLISLGLDINLLTGPIPTSLGKLEKLQRLGLNTNILSGKIPSSIGNLSRLFILDLSNNRLEGDIPTKIADCQNLQTLDISNNRLTGEIPKEIFLLSTLSILLNLSQNLLTGDLPEEVGKLKNINTLDLSENNLPGKIPKTIGDCQVLESLFLQGNVFEGSLPSTLASLKGVQYLDLSRNNLTGEIPKELQKLKSLLYLNLSYNKLDGEVPKEGIFQNTSVVIVVGNPKLCGGTPKLNLQACPKNKPGKGKTNRLKLTIIIVLVVAFFLLSIGFTILYWRRSSQRKRLIELLKLNVVPKISYRRLFQATNGFSPSMLIGTGSFGTVYRGVLDGEGNSIAVKVLNLQLKGAGKSFITECNALRNVRHRNLVKVLTCCSSIDYNGNEFKALVFEYMSNKSLEKWLYLATDGENSSMRLNVLQRLNIAIDVASAIHYLHDDCQQLVIHRDLKPSNVLLDDDMVAHVSDFGIARLVSNTTSFSNGGQTSTTGLNGTVGYVAPEYALGGEPSREGDVYSYGILVLEMFTGKRPTDDMFKDDFNLHNFVMMALPKRLVEIVDSSLLPGQVEENIALTGRELDARNYSNNIRGIEIEIEEILGNQMSAHLQKCLVSVLKIGIACSKESPNERMNMGDVTKELHHIKNAYMSIEIRGQRRRTT